MNNNNKTEAKQRTRNNKHQ